MGDLRPPGAGPLGRRVPGCRIRRGINFFDNAEVYSAGESEEIMGKAIAALGWPRYSYVVSTKLFWVPTISPT